jgi:transcription-repair coupling factor (superfamily II helicase)
MKRQGQVFFVHNHVQTIHQIAAHLSRLVPEANFAVAHGRMKERELESVMMDFVKKKVDVLVCTTIIESGLDIPAANTIVINRADRFGLAQIYQLRGRVGRSRQQAYAYLLIPGEHLISRDAQKRLRALMDFSELGAGFKIALNDLQIRGGGTILGSAQSGHIQAVGYELYLELLEQTISEFKGEANEPEAIDPEINVPLSAFLPEDFIPDMDQRLLAYKRLATLSEGEAINDLALEWRDRYGPLPETVKHLILLAGMRLILKRLRLVSVDTDDVSFTLGFKEPEDLNRVLASLHKIKPQFSIKSDRKVIIEIGRGRLSSRIRHLKRILQEICENVTDTKAG